MLYMFNTRTLEVDSYAHRSRGNKGRVTCDAQTAYRARVLTYPSSRPFGNEGAYRPFAEGYRRLWPTFDGASPNVPYHGSDLPKLPPEFPGQWPANGSESAYDAQFAHPLGRSLPQRSEFALLSETRICPLKQSWIY